MIVLDSHIWIWMHLSPGRLSLPAQEAVRNEAALGISVLSIWEVMVALQRGRIQSPYSPETTIDLWLRATPLVKLPVTEEVVRTGQRMVFNHGDPIDKFIASTAHCESCALITSDAHLLSLDWLKTIKGD